MRKITTIFTGLLISLLSVSAQDIEQSGKSLVPQFKIAKDVNVQFGGFVRAEYIIDNREVVGYVDDVFGIFPKNKVYEDGVDINKQLNQSFSTQATRWNALFTTPDVLGAKSSAFFEFDFTGGNRVNLRLRHAWLKLAWTKTEVLFGKTWSPMTETVFPSVAGLHTGIPFRPFGRTEQLRFTYKPVNELSILFAAALETEHTTTFDGATLRNGVVTPDLHLQLRYQDQNFGAGLFSEFKVIRPTGRKSDHTLSSYGLGAYADYKIDLFNVKGSVIYAQNMSDLFVPGGYAVRSVDATGKKSYTASNSLSCWLNLTYGKTWMVGLFAGWQHNLGYTDNIDVASGGGEFFGKFGSDIDRIYRLSPSLTYRTGQWMFQAEVDYNVADYGIPDYSDKGKVKDTKAVAGVRGLFVTTSFFNPYLYNIENGFPSVSALYKTLIIAV
ncbi:MAG: hypothetical protein LUE93_01580 [Bacteroides sp.]|nr:hypothetical protein [Bacteroides sp.]